MSQLEDTRHAVIAQLDALQASDAVSSKARTLCASLIERLKAPVRIGVFGLPLSGKRALVGALSGSAEIHSDVELPTLLVRHGPARQTCAILADGRRLRETGTLSDALLAEYPVYLDLVLESDGLRGRSLLMVAPEDVSEDLEAAMAWAAPQVDVSIWCSTGWNKTERALWNTAPDGLHNHAILVHTGEAAAPGACAQDDLFACTFAMPRAALDARDPALAERTSQRLRAYLETLAEEGATQDLHAAQLFLRRYGIEMANGTDARNRPKPAATSAGSVSSVAPSGPDTQAGRDGPPRVANSGLSPEATAEVARLFQYLRASAEALRLELHPDDDPDSQANAIAEQVAQILAGASERAFAMEYSQEAWPGLADRLSRAQDIAFLIQMEAGPDQAGEAARLLLQVRQDLETKLAA